MITLGSLFDGIGGFPLAAIRQGITPLWASEIESFPIQVTKHHFPEMLHVGDITKLDGAKLPPVDIICGGSPCQDLSVASCTRAGLAGTRSGLFLEQIRVTKEMRDADIRRGRTGKSVRPRWLCWENVPGVFSSGFPKGEDFRLVLEQIAGIAGNSIPFTQPHPWGWQPAGKLRVGAAFSLAWRVFDAQYWPGTPSGDAGCSLSRILQDNPPRKYYLTRKACLGILRRAKKRGKPLPPQLHAALLVQAGLISQDNISPGKETSGRSSLHGNCLTPWDTQRARIFTPDSVAPTVAGADGGGGRNPAGLLFAAGFLAGQGSAARGIGYQPECSPTLKAAESGSNMVPSVLCLNDQSGSAMDCSPNMFSTPMGLVRTKEQRHQPLVFEGHGIDSRYTGPHPIVPTLSARAGTGGNNLPLALQPEPTMCICGNAIDRQPRNGGNGIGIQTDVAYTLTGADRHAVFRRQWVDKFREGQSASTQSARQGKDATDLICQPSRDTPAVLLIRRLTPLECERLRGFPDGWTDLPGASDSARYTALGNSVAIPCVEYIMAGIAWAAEGD